MVGEVGEVGEGFCERINRCKCMFAQMVWDELVFCRRLKFAGVISVCGVRLGEIHDRLNAV